MEMIYRRATLRVTSVVGRMLGLHPSLQIDTEQDLFISKASQGPL